MTHIAVLYMPQVKYSSWQVTNQDILQLYWLLIEHKPLISSLRRCGNYVSLTVSLVSMPSFGLNLHPCSYCRYLMQIYRATMPHNTISLMSSCGCSTSRSVCLKLMTLSQLNSAKWICGLSYTRWLGLNVGLYVKPAAMTWLIHNSIRLHHLVLIVRIDARQHGHKFQQLWK